MPNAYANISWISWLLMAAVTAAVTCVVMYAKSKCYDRRARMPLLFKVDRSIIVSSNVIAITWLVVWARVLGQNPVRRLELLVLIDMCAGMLAQRWLLSTVHENDNAPYDGPGPLCGISRARRIRLHYVIASMSSGWCAALSMAARPYTKDHVCGYWFMTIVVPGVYATSRTILLDHPVPQSKPLAQSHGESITNEFTIEGEEDEVITDDENEMTTAL